MIGKICGIVEETAKNSLLIKTTSGVSFLVYLSKTNILTLKPGQQLNLYIHTHVRENEIALFGFFSREEQQVFNLLQSISGIGPKTALNIIGISSVNELVAAVQKQNLSFFSQIPGIGKKTAQKILLELSGKFAAEFSLNRVIFSPDDQLVLEALQTLGFKKNEALLAIEKGGKEGTIEERTTRALRQLNNGK